MSRRKNSATVQSTTTRSFRVSSGSWYRWYVRVTNQPGKPQRCRPGTSAIPLKRPSVATWPSIRYPYGFRAPVRFFASRRAWRSACWHVGGSTTPGVLQFFTAAQSPSAHTSSLPSTLKRLVDHDAPTLVEWEPELCQERVRAHTGGPDERPRRNARAVREHGLPAVVVRLQRRADMDLDSATSQPT